MPGLLGYLLCVLAVPPALWLRGSWMLTQQFRAPKGRVPRDSQAEALLSLVTQPQKSLGLISTVLHGQRELPISMQV